MKYLILLISLFSITDSHVNDEGIVSDYYQGLEKAKENAKPILLLFTGNICENNLNVKEVLSDKDLLLEIEEKFIPVFLNVDDPTELESPKHVQSNGKSRLLRTKGHEWAWIEQSKYDENSSPTFFIIDSEQIVLKGALQGNVSKQDLLKYMSDF